MKDQHDTITQELPIKKRRGRPALGARPMTPAEKQKAYRDRLNGNVTKEVEAKIAHAQETAELSIERYAQTLRVLEETKKALAEVFERATQAELERNAAFKAVIVFEQRLRSAGLSTDYRA